MEAYKQEFIEFMFAIISSTAEDEVETLSVMSRAAVANVWTSRPFSVSFSDPVSTTLRTDCFTSS